MTEDIVGLRLSSRGSIEPTPSAPLAELTAKVDRVVPEAFYKNLARWLLSDPNRRPASPFSRDARPVEPAR